MDRYRLADPFGGWRKRFFIALPVQAAAPESGLDGWVLGDYLLVEFLVLLVLGWLTGAYALLFGNLFSIVGLDGPILLWGFVLEPYLPL